MAREVREFAVTVPHGTLEAAPYVADIAFPERVVVAVSYRLPPGPSGMMGWALTSAGTPVIPIQPGTWVVGDDQSATWQLDGYLDSGNWQVTGYNTGAYDHTVYLTFQLDLPAVEAPAPPPPPGSGTGLVGVTGAVTVPVPAAADVTPPATPGTGLTSAAAVTPPGG